MIQSRGGQNAQLPYLSESTFDYWSNFTPLQVKVVKTDFFLSKST